MFQDISQSLVLIAFVWGPLVNGGIQMGTHEDIDVYEGNPSVHAHSSPHCCGLLMIVCLMGTSWIIARS